MTTERELLELAASAAGINGRWERDTSFIQERYQFVVPYNSQGLMTGTFWHPAHNSADGAELEAALGLDVCWKPGYVDVLGDHGGVREFYADHGGNKQKARMWATLRAAAEIGKKQK